MEHCTFCAKECKNRNSRLQHQRFCKSNPNRSESPFKTWKQKNPVAWNKGLTKEDAPQLKRSNELKLHFSKVVTGFASSPEKEDARRNKIKTKILERYSNGWESTAGRCKKYEYVSPNAGTIKVDGTWELVAAKYFDMLGLTWSRNKKRFPYIKPDGKNATYQPDFFIEEWNTFLEIKGYETDLDRCKWSQFDYPLLVWRKTEILQIILDSKSERP